MVRELRKAKNLRAAGTFKFPCLVGLIQKREFTNQRLM
jgi:hypothetical protein